MAGKRRSFTKKQRREILDGRIASGLSVSTYCKLVGISLTSYYRWKKMFLYNKQDTPIIVSTEKDESGAHLEAFSPQMAIRAGKSEILINSDTPAELIKRVLDLACA